MTSGRWVRSTTATRLARQWGVHQTTVDRDAAEASRRIRASAMGKEDVRGQILATLEDIRSKCVQKGEMRTAIEAIRLLSGIEGVEHAAPPPQPTQVKIVMCGDDAKASTEPSDGEEWSMGEPGQEAVQ